MTISLNSLLGGLLGKLFPSSTTTKPPEKQSSTRPMTEGEVEQLKTVMKEKMTVVADALWNYKKALQIEEKHKAAALKHRIAAEEKIAQRKALYFKLFCITLKLQPTPEETKEIYDHYLNSVSTNKEGTIFELNMKTYVKYLETHKEKIGSELNFRLFDKIVDIEDLTRYFNASKTTSVQKIGFTDKFAADPSFSQFVKNLKYKNIKIIVK